MSLETLKGGIPMDNRNYTNYIKQNKHDEKATEATEVIETTATGSQSDENVQNIPENIETIDTECKAAPEAKTTKSDSEAPKAVTGVVVNCEKLNVRSAPSLNAEINLILSKGEGVVILELVKGSDGEDFYKVGNPEHPEYCMAKYIKIN